MVKYWHSKEATGRDKNIKHSAENDALLKASKTASLVNSRTIHLWSSIRNNELQLNSHTLRVVNLINWTGWKVIRCECFVLQPWKFQPSTEYESDHSADGRCGCCRCNRISILVIHMPHKYIIKTLVTCNNSLDWLTECKFLWCASSQTDQSGLWVLADRPVVIEYNHNTNYPACKLLRGFALWEKQSNSWRKAE